LEAERPQNPLSDSLIIVPVRIQENVEYLLEVVQRPSGGPAAQRGYLRFVAQMADLMADYLRRQQLRELKCQEDSLATFERCLVEVARSPAGKLRRQSAADALQELFDVERVFLMEMGERVRLLNIGGLRNVDPRSQLVSAAVSLAKALRQGSAGDAEVSIPQRLAASDRRTADSQSQDTLQVAIDELCEPLGCRELLILPLSSEGTLLAILASRHQWRASKPLLDSQVNRVQAIGALAETRDHLAWWRISAPFSDTVRLTGDKRRTTAIQVGLLRAALVGLVAAVAMFPVGQQIAATAILEPQTKQVYYAPSTGVVSQVACDEGDRVTDGALLLELTSHELDRSLGDLHMEQKSVTAQIEEKTGLLNRGNDLSPLERDQLEFDLKELEAIQSSLQRQSEHLSQQLSELKIVARQPGMVATWDVRNRLLNHPVQAGDLLVATYDPEGKWRLQVNVPDYRAGLVAEAMRDSKTGSLPLRFSLSSHPDQLLEAHVVAMAAQVVELSANDGTRDSRIIHTVAVIPDPDTLPLKKDGAIARATIHCGTVPLCWLVIRDAYWTISSRIRMLW
jgi:multidrug efflux pump subunit AcrA (membrane-fusion protein)